MVGSSVVVAGAAVVPHICVVAGAAVVGSSVVVAGAAVVPHTCVVAGAAVVGSSVVVAGAGVHLGALVPAVDGGAGDPLGPLVPLLGGVTDGTEGWSPLWQVSQPDSVVSS